MHTDKARKPSRVLSPSYRYHPGNMRLKPMPESLRIVAEGAARVYSEASTKELN